jgi:cell division protein FtsZ
MKNAGSALMGIGRASGDNRAAQAAQQAIESPLIEVSIDGAKGVLFNVTGGYDMSMSEIQEAAEIITSAVAPDANIIFGATLKPEMEDDLIITVIATGFDSQYFHDQAVALSSLNLTGAPVTGLHEAPEPAFDEPSVHDIEAAKGSHSSDDLALSPTASSNDDVDAAVADAVSSINLNLDDTDKAPLHDDAPTTGIWQNVSEDESDTPAFLRRRKKKKD